MATIKKTVTKKTTESSKNEKDKKMENIKVLIDDKKVMTITFDLVKKKVNLLTQEVMIELNKILDIAEQKNPKALVFRSAKKGCFIAGADINEILKMKSEEEIIEKVNFGQKVFNRIENFTFPVIAIIDGMALGGGMELALACHCRIVSEKAQLGLPEVRLGLLPGFGGTQRLPRIGHFLMSITMLISGKSIDEKQALKFGIADYCIPTGYIDFELPKIIDKVTKINKKRKKSWDILSLPLIRTIVLNQIENKILQKTQNNYPAPLAIISLLKKTLKLKHSHYEKGFDLEKKSFAKLAMMGVAKNLMHLFQNNQQLKKEDWGNKKINTELSIDKAAVVGAGKMGSGICWLLSNYDKKVRLFDLNQKSINAGFREINNYNKQLLKYKKATTREIENHVNKISFSTDLNQMPPVDLIVEAAAEKIEIKKKIYENLEKFVSNHVVIASNTSSLPIEKLSAKMKNPQRFLGIHFFNPVNRMPLVEIIPSKKTNAETIALAVNTLRKMDKIVILVKDSPGFLVNRILFSYLREAVELLEEIKNPQKIDEIFLDFGMPMGPIRLLDEIGLDIAVKVAETLHEAFGERMAISPLLKTMVEEKKWLGRKSKKGFYDYSQGKATSNKELFTLLKGKKNKVRENHILQRPIMQMIHESVLCYQESICKKVEHIDLAMIYGTGFPPFLGGPLKYLSTIGISQANKTFQNLASHYGSRFYACDFLKQMEQQRKDFYSTPT